MSLRAAWKSIALLMIVAFFLGRWWTLRTAAKYDDYWRLSNYRLRETTKRFTNDLLSYSAMVHLNDEKNHPNPEEDQLAVRADYMHKYRYRANALRESLLPRVSLQNRSVKVDPNIYDDPPTYKEIEMEARDLERLADELPHHRSLSDWIEAFLSP